MINEKILPNRAISIYSNSTNGGSYDPKSSITFTAPFDGIIEINGSWSAWGFGAGTVSMAITNTAGNATLLASYGEQTNGHDTNPVPIHAKAYYSIVKGTQYTFNAQATGRSGTANNIYIIGVLRKESV